MVTVSIDHMFYDGLQSPFDRQLMGVFAGTRRRNMASRAAIRTFCHRIHAASLEGHRQRGLRAGITPVTVKGRKGEIVVERDEARRPQQDCHMKPAFRKDGTVTAAALPRFPAALPAVLMSAAEA
jgi:acetyl-CoA C-acetyltransferase